MRRQGTGGLRGEGGAACGPWDLFPVAESLEGGGMPLGSFLRGRLESREPTRPCGVARFPVPGGVAGEGAVGMGYGFTETGTDAPSCACRCSVGGEALVTVWREPSAKQPERRDAAKGGQLPDHGESPVGQGDLHVQRGELYRSVAGRRAACRLGWGHGAQASLRAGCGHGGPYAFTCWPGLHTDCSLAASRLWPASDFTQSDKGLLLPSPPPPRGSPGLIRTTPSPCVSWAVAVSLLLTLSPVPSRELGGGRRPVVCTFQLR